MQHVLRLLETRDSVHVTELAEAFSVSEVTIRSDLSALAAPGARRARAGRRARPPTRPVRSRVRPPPPTRGRAQAGDRPRRGGARRRGRGGRARREHDRVLPRARAAGEARARRRHERALVATALADAPGISVLVTGGMLRLSAMSLVGDLGTDVLRTTRINKGFLGARGLSLERGPHGPEPRRGADQAGDGRRLRAGLRNPRRDKVAPQRTAHVRAVDQLAGIVTDSSAPESEVEAWRAAGVKGHHRRPRAARAAAPPAARLRRAVRNDEQVG